MVREAAGVYLDGGRLTFKGETAAVRGVAAEAISHLISVINTPEAGKVEVGLGPYTLDLVTGWMLEDSKPIVRLTKIQAQMTGILMASSGRVVREEKLMVMLYSHKAKEPPGRRVLAVFLHTIRKKFKRSSVAITISTVRGVGLIARLA